MRFAMRLDPWWRPFLLLIGVTPGNACVAVGSTTVRVRFGLFRYSMARSRIAAARAVSASWWYGIGVHTNAVSDLVVNGSLTGLVELRLEPPKTVWALFVPVRCARLYLSLEDPEALLQALGRGAPVAAS